MTKQYRILQVRAIYKTGIKSGVKLDLIVSDLEEFKEKMLTLTGADELDVTYDSVNDNYCEECGGRTALITGTFIHSTDWNGKCFKCGEQVFVREPK